MIGRTLGHYRVVDKIGEGGMGEVYLAEDLTLHRKVALKVLPAELASSRERLERFQREAELLAVLNHHNIVTIYSVEAAVPRPDAESAPKAAGLRAGRTSPAEIEVHFLTMELVDGGSLGGLILDGGLVLEQFFDLAIPMADALSEAHEAGIVHRDLKPANVMVDRKGRVKILDFGLAKLRRTDRSVDFSELPTEVMTEEGKVLGTYPYMSPEQVEGKAVDHRSDIFSLGTMLYEMTTGRRPFQGDNPASMMSSILRDTPSEVDTEREGLPHHLSRIIGRCLEKDVDDRYQRARDLFRDLSELRQEVQTGAATLRRRSVALATRRPWRLGAILGAAAILVLAVILFRTQPWEPSATPEAVPRITSLAVLPLQNLSGDPEQDYYAAGITEGLIAELGQIGALRVISRRSVIRYLDSERSVPEIAAELDVDALIEGSVLPVGDRVRITAQLVRAEPEEQLWAESYERDAKDILKLLRELTDSMVGEIQVAVSAVESRRLAEAREVDPEAHRLYLKALEAEAFGTPEELPKAVGFLHRALEIDPDFAEAWVQLAKNSAWLAILYLPASMEAERVIALEEMNAAIETALTLDNSLSRAHSVQGFIHAYIDWDWARAEQAHLRAVELNPSSSTAHIYYAELLTILGRFEEAIAEAALAEDLDPYSADVLLRIADIQYFAQDFEASLQYLDRAWELSPGFIDNLYYQGRALAALGREQEAVRAWQEMQGILGNFALAAAYEGLSVDEMNRTFMEFHSSLDEPFFGPGDLAGVTGALGESEWTLGLLEEAFASRDDPGKTAGHRFIFLKVNPNFQHLHSDPRFQDLLRRMNLAD